MLFSDGVPEAQNRQDEEFGETRLVACVRAAAGEGSAATIDRITASIDAFAGDAPQFDDITLMVVRRR